MDKNTLTGLLLMGLVLFGFMYCNKPERTPETATTQTETTVQAQAIKESPEKKLINNLTGYVNAYGTPVPGDTTGKAVSVSTAEMNVTLNVDSTLTGTIKTNGQDIDLKDITGDPASSQYDPDRRRQVVNAVNKRLDVIMEYQEFAQFVGRPGKTVTLTNGKMNVTFDAAGGMIKRVVLPGYKTEVTDPATDVEMFNASSAAYAFTFKTVNQQKVQTNALTFDLDSLAPNKIRMSLNWENGAQFAMIYTLVPDEYVVKLDIEQKDMDKVLPTTVSDAGFDWIYRMKRNEKGRTFEERNSAIYYKYVDETPEDLNALADDSEDLQGQIRWIAFKNQFFSSIIIPRTTFSTAEVASWNLKDNDSYVKRMDTHATFRYKPTDAKGPGFDFYFGPNDYSTLSHLDDVIAPDQDGLELTRIIPLGWGIFRWINTLIIIPVFNFLGSFITNYGIIILLLTIFIKIILFPFTYKSYMSQAKMRVLAPEIKEINEKYPGQENAMKRQQETMKLYSRAGASPFSGCLPMLLQMPVLIAMFSFFPSAIELRGQSFLWAHDLSAPDVIFTLPFSIPFYGDKVSLFCLLMTVVNIVYTRINMQNQPGNASMPGMKWMMYLMPVMFLFFFNDYASGLSYYYFLSLLITIIQTYIFRRVIDEKKVRAEMEANAKKPRKKKGFMARLEAAQKKQEAMMREQAKQNARRRR
ncbi:MAG: membrane protein insertase YidC [Muribaculaceae bacterium]|nr:membrane protein insertase YidC [Muribaculaceae bacterium]